MIDNNNSVEQLLKAVFDLKAEMSSYKQETDKKITKLENTIEKQKVQLKEKDNEIAVLKQTIVEIKETNAKATAIMQNEIVNLKQENNRLKKELKLKDKEIQKLNIKIDKLEKENVKLKNRLAKNSCNSSKPSSTDGFHKNVHSLREKSSNRVGGQKNHTGTNLNKKNVEKIINSKEATVIKTSEILYVNNKKLDGITKFIIDTQMSVIVKELNLVYKEDAKPLPKELKNNVTYGNNLKSLISLLNIEHAIPVKRTVDLIKELTNDLIKISTGTVQNIIYELQTKVTPVVESIKEQLLRSEVNHKDETMLFCNGSSRWLHVLSNKNATYYYYHQKRGNIADVEKGILNIFNGTLVHDHMKGLYRFGCDHAECNAHILRYLQFSIEKYHRKWAFDLQQLLLEIKKKIETEMKKGNNCLRVEDILKYEQRYYEILENGNNEYKKDTNPHKDYNGDDMKLLRRLKKYGENHLLFMYDFNIPFDNNLAERDLRMIKAKKKISGGFRSDKGGEAYTDIKSYLSTMRKQGKNLYQSIKLAFEKNPVLLGC